jgi:hypothetical protein
LKQALPETPNPAPLTPEMLDLIEWLARETAREHHEKELAKNAGE